MWTVPLPANSVQVRFDDEKTRDLRWLNHFQTSLAVSSERDMASALGAGCSVPLGVLVEFRGGETVLLAALHDGHGLFRVESRAPATDPHAAVIDAIARLRDAGARLPVAR